MKTPLSRVALLLSVCALAGCPESPPSTTPSADASEVCETLCGSGCCSSGQTCVEGSCMCAPNCEGRACGPDGCGGSCGSCAEGESCNPATFACEEGCVSESNEDFCQRGQAECGPFTAEDNCGRARTTNCGSCTSPLHCATNRCVGDCSSESDAEFCADRHLTCGPASGQDRCGLDRSVADCGACEKGERCEEGSCVPCEPELDSELCARNGKECGAFSGTDNCGTPRTVNSCGSCAAGKECASNNVCAVPGAPPNDTCTGAQPLVFGADGRVEVSGTTVGAVNDGDACGSRGADVVYTFSVPVTSSVDITLTPVGNFDVSVRVTRRCDSTAAADLVACVDEDVGGEPEQVQLRHLAPGTYWLWVDGYFPSTRGSFSLALHRWDSPPTPVNDLCTGAESLTFDAGNRVILSVDTTTATNDDTGVCGAMDGPDLVYSFDLDAPAGILARLARPSGVSDPKPALYLRADCAATMIDERACATEIDGVATIALPSLPAGTWYLFVDSASARAGSFTLEVLKLAPVNNDSCGSPANLTFDSSGVATATASGSTLVASPDTSGTCGGLASKDVVFQFTTADERDFTAVVTGDGSLQPIVYLRSSCELGSSQPANGCAAAPAGGSAARLTVPGLSARTWYLWVDGANGTAGAFGLTVTLTPVAGTPDNDVCAGAEPLNFDSSTNVASTRGDTTGAADHYSGTCALMPAADLVYRFELSRPAAVIATVTRDPLSPTFNPALYLRTDCANGAGINEAGCAVHAAGEARVVVPALAAGTHYLVVDGTGTGRGAFDLEVRQLPAVENSVCGGAVQLEFDAAGVAGAMGDTGLAAHSATGLCASAGPDLVYRFDLTTEKDVLVTATPVGSVSAALSVHVRSDCEQSSTELGCAAASSSSAEAVLGLKRLPAGPYVVWVDGTTAGLGRRFALTVATSDPVAAPGHDHCRGALPLAFDPLTNRVSTTGSTLGAANDYAGTCSRGSALHTGPDVVYSFSLSTPAAVSARVARTGGDTGFKPAIYLRSGDCESTDVFDEAFCGSATTTVVNRTAVNLGAGTHYLVVDGANGSAGNFELELTKKPIVDIPDNCALAKPLAFDSAGLATVHGNTAQANDTSTGLCSPSPGSDLVYSFTLANPSNVSAKVRFDWLTSDEWRTVYVRRECGSHAAADQLACGSGIDSVSVLAPELSAGTYYVWVDHDGRSDGAFELEVRASKVAANDTCSGAEPLTFDPATGIATVSGDTSFALSDGDGSCNSSSGPDVVYTFDLDEPRRVQVEVTTTGHRPGVHVRSACDKPATEISCAQAASGKTASDLTIPLLPAGRYYVWVDGYMSTTKGPFTLKVTASAPLQAPPANTNCAGAQQLMFDANNKAILKAQSTATAGNDAQGTCEVTGGGDLVYVFTTSLAHKLTAKVTRLSNTPGFNPVVYLRSACEDGAASAELTCAKPTSSGVATATVNQLPAGTYYLWVDGAGGSSGSFDLEVTLAAPSATAPTHESCANAKPLVFNGPTVTERGTTYQSRHEARGSCTTTEIVGDVVYSIELREAQKLTATVTPSSSTFRPALYLRTDCGSADRFDEPGCAAAKTAGSAATLELHRVEAGTYFLWIDGDTDTTGEFDLTLTLGPPEPQPANDTCASPIALTLGDTVSGTTIAADDSSGAPPFSAACEAYSMREIYGPDVVYSYAPSRTGNFTVTLTPTGYDAILWVSAGVCGAPRSCIAAKNSGFSGGAEVVTIAGEAGTTYYIVIDSGKRTAHGSYTLRLQ